MWSRIKRLGLAWKLTLLDAIVFSAVLSITSLLVMTGLYYSLYKQAENALGNGVKAMRSTVENPDPEMLRDLQRVAVKVWLDERKIEPKLEDTMEGPRGLPLFTMLMARQGSLPPGVAMRVVRNHDRAVVYDTAPAYPKSMEIEKALLQNENGLVKYKYRLAELNGGTSMFYHHELVDWGQVSYTVCFMCLVNADHRFIHSIGMGLLLINMCGVVLALFLCHFLSRRALRPLNVITEEMQGIEVDRLDDRVTVPEAQDEIYSLAGSANRMLDRLKEGLEREQRFVSDASHELRTPLAIIMGHAGLLRRWGKGDPEMLEESLEAIYSEAEGMSKLVQRLLELARADQKRLKLQPELVEIGGLVNTIYRELLPVEAKTSLALEENEAGYAVVDEASVRELLLILLDNARKYTPEGGSVSLFSLRENNEIHFGVRDTGVGISEEDLPHIFERFYRVDNARTRQTGGSGLGLALAQTLAQANGGRLVAESRLGEGTCMHVYLPLVELE